MERTFRQRDALRQTAIICLVFFVLIGIASAVGIWFAAAPQKRGKAIYFIGFIVLFWGSGAVASIWALLAHRKETLTVNEDGVVFDGLTGRRVIDFNGAKEVLWRIGNGGVVVLKSLTDKLAIKLGNYEENERVWIIRHLQERIPESCQDDWDVFCFRVAVPLLQDDKDNETARDPDKVVLTRGRWDRWFLPVIALCCVFGAFMWWRFERWQFVLVATPFTVVWLITRFLTPRRGLVDKRLSSDPDVVRFLWFLFFWGALGILGIKFFDEFKLQPPQSQIVGTALSILWLAVLAWRAHQEDVRRNQKDKEAAPEAIETWNAAKRQA